MALAKQLDRNILVKIKAGLWDLIFEEGNFLRLSLFPPQELKGRISQILL